MCEDALVVDPDGTSHYVLPEARTSVIRVFPDAILISVWNSRFDSRLVWVKEGRATPIPAGWLGSVSRSGRTLVFGGRPLNAPVMWRDGAERWLERPAYDTVAIAGVNDVGVAVGTAWNDNLQEEDPVWSGNGEKDVTPFVWFGERAFRLDGLLDAPGARVWHLDSVNEAGQIGAVGVYQGKFCVLRLTPVG